MWAGECSGSELAIGASDLGHRMTPGAKFRGRQKMLQERDPGAHDQRSPGFLTLLEHDEDSFLPSGKIIIFYCLEI